MKIKLLSIFVLFFIINHGFAQQSYSTEHAIFKLNNEQARSLLINKSAVDSSYFKQLITKYNPNDLEFSPQSLPHGNYTDVSVKKTNLVIEYFAVQNITPFVINNNTDLLIAIQDKQGNQIKNIDVKLKNKTLKYDEKLKAFRLKKTNKEGILTITYEGINNYYMLDREYDIGNFKRTSRKLLYGTPIKYIARPARYFLHLPIDGYKSIKNGQLHGSIYKTVKPVKDIVNTFQYDEPEGWLNDVVCLFAPHAYYCDEDDFVGYMTFSKPKYRPEDTIKFKSFIVKDKKGKPIKKALDVVLSPNSYGSNGRKKLATIKPYRPGAFAYSFTIQDSLEMKLDKQYRILLEDQHQIYYSSHFRYEDYDLLQNNFSLRANKTALEPNDSLIFYLEAKDENDLALFNIDYEFTLTTNSVKNQSPDNLFTPNLLFQQKGSFSDTISIHIPDSIFQKADLNATAKVLFKDAGNEYQEERVTINYNHKIEGVTYYTKADKLYIQYKKAGKEINQTATITDLDRFSYTIDSKVVQLPHTHRLNPMAASYLVEINDEQEEIYLDEESGLTFNGYYELGSAFIQSTNPKNIDFQYFIYEGNHLLKEGLAKSLNETLAVSEKNAVTLIINHVWQGENYTNTYNIKPKKNLATLTVEAPELVYPGQKVEVKIKATNHKDQPINNMDITAQAYKSSFERGAPQLPYFPEKLKYKNIINKFNLREQNTYLTENAQFDFKQWNTLFGLDSLDFYQIRNPKQAITKHFSASKDSVTQFTPIVVKEGKIQQTIVVELNRVPVYFDFVDQQLPYVFKVKSQNKHHIKIRLTDKSIELTDIDFAPFGKTILVIDIDQLSKEQVKEMPTILEGEELYAYNPYIFHFRRPTKQNELPRIEQEGRIILLQNGRRNQSSGPLYPREFNYKDEVNNYRLKHEPGFEYEFLPELVKMRSIDLPERYALYNKEEMMPLHQKVVTQDSLSNLRAFARIKNIKSSYFKGMNALEKGTASLVIETPNDSTSQQILYTLLYPIDHTDQVFLKGGLHNKFLNFKSGEYQLFYLTDTLAYTTTNKLNIFPDGENFYRINQWVKTDNKTANDVQLLLKGFMKKGTVTYQEENYVKQVINQNKQPITYNGRTTTVFGVVIDENDEPIIGATIMVPNTRIGAITNIDGSFSLEIPINTTELTVMYVGSEEKTIPVKKGYEMIVTLKSDVNMLDEVVVTGYGVSEKRSLSYSVVTAGEEVESLQGRVAGITIQSSGENLNAVTIRGSSSLSGNQEPLYIIDGVLYRGKITDLEAYNFASATVIKGSDATALYGSRAANGVVLITTTGGIEELNLPGNFEKLPKAPKAQPQLKSSLRDHFSDEGLWQPQLSTNANGEASFIATFPDDVTKWDMHFLAMNGKKLTGQYSTSVRSYKPILAELHAPRFLTEGDQIKVVGELNNYTEDEVNGTASFNINDDEVFQENISLTQQKSFTLTVRPKQQDSINLLYQFKVPDLEFLDGEKRKLPVNKRGVLENKGQFFALIGDTSVVLSGFPKNEPVTIHASASKLALALQEVDYLKNYKHLCNEQLASKLSAYLWDRKLTILRGENYKHDKEINQIIARLEKGKNGQNIWGWWPDNSFVPWINQHVIHALIFAKKEGFNIPDLSGAEQAMIIELEQMNNKPRRVLDILQSLTDLETPIDYGKYLDSLVIDNTHYENRLRFDYLKKQHGLPHDLKYVDQLLQKDMMGNYKLKTPATERYGYYPASRQFEMNLYSYKLLSDERIKRDILHHLLSERTGQHFRNTYQSSLMLDLLAEAGAEEIVKGQTTKLVIEADGERETIDVFPKKKELISGENVALKKTGPSDVYVSATYSEWINEPKTVDSLFMIQSKFVNEKGKEIVSLQKGEPVTLSVTVNAVYDANYVMISIPIPSSCQYRSKHRGFGENYREHYKDETLIFIEDFKAGSRTFNIELLPRFSGSFTMNPAKAELMYAPIKFGRNEIEDVEVVE